MATNTNESSVAALATDGGEKMRSKTLLQKALWRIRHDRLTMAAMGGLLLIAVLCYAEPLVTRLLDIEYNKADPYSSYAPSWARVSDSESTMQLWQTETGAIYRPMIGHPQPVLAMDFSSDGALLVAGDTGGAVRLWQVIAVRSLIHLAEHDGPVNAVAFSPDDRFFLSASDDHLVKVWETDPLVHRDPLAGAVFTPSRIFEHSSAVLSVEYSPDGAAILAGTADGNAQLWNAINGEPILTLVGHTGAVNAVAFSPDGARILTGSADQTARLWDAATGELQLTLSGHTAVINSVAFAPDGRSILTGSDDHTARLWSAADGALLHTFTGHTAAVNSAVFTADGAGVLTGSADQSAILWNIATGAAQTTFVDAAQSPYAITSAAISPDGRFVITGDEGRRRLYVLGTDGSGRDVITRLLKGGQVSLRIGFLSALGALSIGVVLGVMTGYYGGVFDDVVIWIITTLNSIPSLFLLLIVSSVLAPNATSLILVLVFLVWTGSTRIVRGETFALREREFIIAARAIGASQFRIMFLHIVPNVISILLIVLTRLVAGLILTESTLSFLGFGVKPPTPTWGNMLSGDLNMLRLAPQLVFVPGFLITLTVLCLYVIGDGLRDAFDPRIAD